MTKFELKMYEYLFKHQVGTIQELKKELSNDAKNDVVDYSSLDMLFVLGILAKGVSSSKGGVSGSKDIPEKNEYTDQYRVTEFGKEQIRLKYALSQLY